jgi:hypothetical protein
MRGAGGQVAHVDRDGERYYRVRFPSRRGAVFTHFEGGADGSAVRPITADAYVAGLHPHPAAAVAAAPAATPAAAPARQPASGPAPLTRQLAQLSDERELLTRARAREPEIERRKRDADQMLAQARRQAETLAAVDRDTAQDNLARIAASADAFERQFVEEQLAHVRYAASLARDVVERLQRIRAAQPPAVSASELERARGEAEQYQRFVEEAQAQLDHLPPPAFRPVYLARY